MYGIVYFLLFGLNGFGYGNLNEGEVAKRQFLAENSELRTYLNETIVCFADRKQTEDTAFGMVILLISFFMLGIIILVVLFARIQNIKTMMHKTTYRLQIMLFRALAVQLATGYIFMLIPGK
jgi:hypothetical protein